MSVNRLSKIIFKRDYGSLLRYTTNQTIMGYTDRSGGCNIYMLFIVLLISFVFSFFLYCYFIKKKHVFLNNVSRPVLELVIKKKGTSEVEIKGT